MLAIVYRNSSVDNEPSVTHNCVSIRQAVTETENICDSKARHNNIVQRMELKRTNMTWSLIT